MGRDFLDRYWTPSEVVVALFDYLALPTGTRVLEPCVGRPRRIAAVAEAFGLDVWTGDLDDGAIDPEDPKGVVWEFCTAAREGHPHLEAAAPEWVVSNPPFKTDRVTAAAIVEACLAVAPRVALLMNLNQLEVANDRAALLSLNPPNRLLLLPRPRFEQHAPEGHAGELGSPPISSAWFIWWPDAPLTNRPIQGITRAQLNTYKVVGQGSLFERLT